MDPDGLVELARKRFGEERSPGKGKELSPADQKLFESVAAGKPADYSAEADEENGPAAAEKGGADRVLDAERIGWLCTDRQASALVTHRGIIVEGARIDGKLDLAFAEIGFRLAMMKCAVPGGINLEHTAIRALNLVGTHTGPIFADGMKVEGDVFLRDGFKAQGEVRLLGVTIGGDLDCVKGQFVNAKGNALSADGMQVEGSVFLGNGFEAQGNVRLLGVKIGQDLSCRNGEFVNGNGWAISGDRVTVKGSVLLDGTFKAHGEVRLLGATIGRNLACGGGDFLNGNGVALNADGMKVEGDLFFTDGFKAQGRVRLLGATIGGDVNCQKGEFVNGDGRAFSGDRITVEGGVFLGDGFNAQGEVGLVGARIGGDLDCEKGQFVNGSGRALNGEGMTVRGHVFLRSGVTIEGNVDLIHATVERSFQWHGVSSAGGVTLDLRHARMATLLDEDDSWPKAGRLHLDGLVYDRIDEHAPVDAERRIEWLRRQPETPFRPQPYEQLAAVLRKGGHNDAARCVLIAREKDRTENLFPRTKWQVARLKRVVRSQWWWYRELAPIIGYGFRPWVALWRVVVLLAFGCAFFGIGWWADLMTATDRTAYVAGGDGRHLSEDYQTFNWAVYSLDTFVPLVDLDQKKYFLPDPNRGAELPSLLGWLLGTTGGALRAYMWIHIIAGWTLTTLLVVGLTGLVRKEGGS